MSPLLPIPVYPYPSVNLFEMGVEDVSSTSNSLRNVLSPSGSFTPHFSSEHLWMSESRLGILTKEILMFDSWFNVTVFLWVVFLPNSGLVASSLRVLDLNTSLGWRYPPDSYASGR